MDKAGFSLFQTGNVVMSSDNVVGVTVLGNLKLDMVQHYYFPASFSFDYLKQVEDIFKGIKGAHYDATKIRCIFPKLGDPFIFIYQDLLESAPQNAVVLIAPRARFANWAKYDSISFRHFMQSIEEKAQ